jgi:uncharacterized protein RhaS with RHS repeats
LYYLQSRYYNPEWGRFINADDVGGKIGELLSHNVFTYCTNNPVNMSDPDGHLSISSLFQSAKSAISNAVNSITKHVVATVATIAITLVAIVGINYIIRHPHVAAAAAGGATAATEEVTKKVEQPAENLSEKIIEVLKI